MLRKVLRGAATFGYFLLFLLIFILPLATQLPDLARDFQKMLTPGGGVSEIVRTSLAACLAAALLGAFVFSGWRRMAWTGFMLICALAIFRADIARQSWPAWSLAGSDSLFLGFYIEMLALGLIPLIVHLWKKGHPVRDWARMSVGYVAVFQALAVLAQFLIIRFQGPDALEAWGLRPTGLFTARDSSGAYRDALRLTGFARTPNMLAMILTLTWPALIPLAERPATGRSGSKFLPLLQAALVVIAVAAIVFTYSRAAYLGLFLQAACVAGLLVALPRFRTWKSVLGVVAVLAGIVLALATAPHSSTRVAAVGDGADASITNRLAVYRVALSLLAERPLSGWGPGFFNTLYNRFYRLPHEQYSFYDCHSALLHALMELGLAGVGLGVFALAGWRWRGLWRRLPPWAWIGPVGAFLPWLTDNPTCYPAALFPAIWISGTWAVTSLESERADEGPNPTTKPARRFPVPVSALAPLFLLLWLAGYAVPMSSPDQRFQRELEKMWRGPLGTTSFHVEDLVTGRTWSRHQDLQRPAASVAKLAIAAALVDKCRDEREVERLLPLESAWATGSGILHVSPVRPESIPLGNALYLMLSQSDNTASNALLDHIGRNTIAEVTKRVTGTPVYFSEGFGRKASGSGKMEPTYDGPVYNGAEISPRQLSQLMIHTLETSSPLTGIAEAALIRKTNIWGLPRHLHGGVSGTVLSKSGTTNNLRNHVLVYRDKTEYWVISVMREERTPRAGVDQHAYRAMGEMAWMAYLYLKH